MISFDGNKTVTCGGGGMIVGNNQQLLDYIRYLTTTARITSEYDFDMVGFNYRMTNIQAAVGCAQMERLNEFVEKKRKVREFYEKSLSSIEGITFFPATDGSSCWFSGIVLGEQATIHSARLICSELKKKRIEARTFWKPVHMQEPYKNAPKTVMSNAESLWKRIITLPCSTNIRDNELQYVVKSVKVIISEL